MAQRRPSRKRRGKQGSRRTPQAGQQKGGYAAGRRKDEAARRALRPLRPGQRPKAVTVGAIAALVLALANLVALAVGFKPHELGKASGTALGAAILLLVAVGMWRARYWAVLGMQTLLALSMLAASLALLRAASAWAALLALLIVIACGTLFWFLVKAMARIQMPSRPAR
jgi:hypothetical protein